MTLRGGLYALAQADIRRDKWDIPTSHTTGYTDGELTEMTLGAATIADTCDRNDRHAEISRTHQQNAERTKTQTAAP